ncbi:MAG: MBOAT family O-acyltransferase [Alphaproteobacteria bacterium]
MNAISWTIAIFVLVFFLVARYVFRPAQRHGLMTAGAVAFIFLQNPPGLIMRFAFILLTFIILLVGWQMGKVIARRPEERKRGGLRLGIIFLLAPLVIFKLVQAVIPTHLLEMMTSARGNFELGSFAPLGISYFTFRALAYLIEIRRGNVEPVGWWRYLNYVAFWPTFMAGPIERPGTFLEQTSHEVAITNEDVRVGMVRIMSGLVKKLILGGLFYQTAKPFMFLRSGNLKNFDEWTTWQVWISLTAYYLYLYCDFAGYTDIAIGAARMFGYRIMENFRWPILATNVADFWRRWHISLTSWLRDYVYFHLGGSRKGLDKAARYTVVAMVLIGLWHGLTIHFALWGLYHAIFLNIYRRYRKEWRKKERPKVWWRTGLAWLVTFQIINLGWVLFLFRPRVAFAVYMKLFGLS